MTVVAGVGRACRYKRDEREIRGKRQQDAGIKPTRSKERGRVTGEGRGRQHCK